MVYKDFGGIEIRSQFFLGTDIYGSLNTAFDELGSDIFIDKHEIKRYIPNDIEEIVISSAIFAKLIHTFCFVGYMNRKNDSKNEIDKISKLLTIVLNDSENKSVGGNIDGNGNELEEQYICQRGEFKKKDYPLRRYTYRENLQFRLDKVRILPGEKNIADMKKRHTVIIEKIHGMEESFDPVSMYIIGLVQGKEYINNVVESRIQTTLKINIKEILENISGVGNECRYELDGNMLVPDVVLPSKIIGN